MAAENPFSLDKINLRLPEFSGLERDILLAIRVEQPRGDNFLFANSSLVKCRLLEHTNVSPNGEVHPSILEAAALVASITYFERLNCQSPHYCEFQTLRNDNYSMAYWIFACLFKEKKAFLSQLTQEDLCPFGDGIKAEALDRLRVDDLKMEIHDGLEFYTNKDGEIMLEFLAGNAG